MRTLLLLCLILLISIISYGATIDIPGQTIFRTGIVNSCNLIMSGGYDGKVILWDIKGSTLVKNREVADIAKIS